MSRSSKVSNIAKDVIDQPSRNEGEGYKEGDSEQIQMSNQDQSGQQLPRGNNSRQSSPNSHHPQQGNTQPGIPFSQGHPPSTQPPQKLQSQTEKGTLQRHGDESLAGKPQPSVQVSDQEQHRTKDNHQTKTSALVSPTEYPSDQKRDTLPTKPFNEGSSNRSGTQKQIVLYPRPQPPEPPSADPEPRSGGGCPCCSIL